VDAYRKEWLRALFSAAHRTQGAKSKDIREDMSKARDAWFRVMGPYKNSFGCIQLPHPAPMLTDKQVEGCYVLPDRETILQKMKRGGIVAEVGVQAGEFSRSILDICSPSQIHLIDIDLRSHAIHEKFGKEINAGIVQLQEEDSSSALKKFPDSFFDFIYIDGDHSYNGVKKDIEAGKSKVKKDGFLIFNDYTYWSPCECMEYGVIQAVNELCREDDWKMIYFAFGYYMYCDVAIRRR